MNTEHPVYTGFWLRVLAAIIDAFLLMLLTYPLLILFYGWEYFDMSRTGFIAGPADLILSWILPAALIIGLWQWKQATPGKMTISSVIIDAKTGGKPRFHQWLIRYLGTYVSALPLGLGFLWVAFDDRRRAWHDMMAGTLVIQKRNIG